MNLATPRVRTLVVLLAVGALIAVAVVRIQAGSAPVSAKGTTPAAATPIPLATEDIMPTDSASKLQTATFGSGCFWCTEAVFQQLKGVERAVSGYTGGQVKNPTYEQICTGETGHAEVIQVTYDPAVISFPDLLEVFWKTHDPTTLNRQGADVGTQYRSAVFFHDEEQRELAEAYKEKLDAAGAFNAPIVTEITSASTFYPAEDYHQQYYDNNARQPYCQRIIRPKLDKLREVFAEKLK